VRAPAGDFTTATLRFIDELEHRWENTTVTVLIPELFVTHWWEHLLHNQSALRLKGRLLFTPGVMVTSVPYQLLSSQGAEERQDRVERVAGQVRRGARKTSGDR
jgi:hypothetical protein